MATPSKGVVGAIIPSNFASENPAYTNGSLPFYWKEETRNKKCGRLAVWSSDGYIHNVTKGREDGPVCHYRCQYREKEDCTGTLSVIPNGRVTNRVIHNCQQDQAVIDRGKEILCQSRQSDESAYFSSPSMPFSATLPGSPMPEQLLELDTNHLLRFLFDAGGETDLSHTQRDNPSDLSREQGGQLPDGNLQLLSTRENTDNGIQSSFAIKEATRPPRIATLVQVQEVQTVTIICNLDHGHPTSTVAWSKEGTVVNFVSDERITIVRNKQYEQLQIQDFQQSDEGMYQVSALNSVGNDVRSIKIAYNGSSGSKPKFTSNPQDQRSVSPGSLVIFSAEATGDNVRYKWRHNGEDMSDEDWRITGSNMTTLVITSAELKDEGKYELVASNEHGKDYSIPADLEFRVDELCEAQMAVSESSGPTLSYSFNSCMADNQGTGAGIQTSTRYYDIVPTQATDNGGSSELATGHLHTSHVDTVSTDLKLSTEATDTGEHSELVITGLMQRLVLPSNNEINSTLSVACNSQNSGIEELCPVLENVSNYEQLQIQDFQQSDEGMYQFCAHNGMGSAVDSITVHCNGSSEGLFEDVKFRVEESDEGIKRPTQATDNVGSLELDRSN